MPVLTLDTPVTTQVVTNTVLVHSILLQGIGEGTPSMVVTYQLGHRDTETGAFTPTAGREVASLTEEDGVSYVLTPATLQGYLAIVGPLLAAKVGLGNSTPETATVTAGG